jgi:hypothetical protein
MTTVDKVLVAVLWLAIVAVFVSTNSTASQFLTAMFAGFTTMVKTIMGVGQ